MVAIIAATPLQLFNSMMIMRHHYKEEKCDFFILGIACDMHHYVEKYMQANMIESAYFIDRFHHNQSSFGKFCNIFYTTNSQREILKEAYKKSYDHLFTTWVGVSSSWLYTRLIKKNPQMQLHFYEEGIGVYIKSIFIRNEMVKMFYRSFGNRLDEDNIKDIYAYKPEMCNVVNPSLPCIPIGDFDEDDFMFMQQVNNDIVVHPYKCKVLYFESSFQEYADKRGIDENSIIEGISIIVGKNNVIVRTHPRTDPKIYVEKGWNIDRNVKTNWEYILSQKTLPNDTVLIAATSTALFTPNIIFGLEPKVIFIGKCIQNENKQYPNAKNVWSNSVQELCNMLIASYKDKSRIMIPESYLDLTELLKVL